MGLPYADFELRDDVALPWDDEPADGVEVAAWYAHRDAVVAGLIEFDPWLGRRLGEVSHEGG